MALTNQTKPAQSQPENYLSIGSGFTLLIGGGYKLLINPLVSLFTNQDKASIGETWGTIASTWATETRTWEEVSQLIDNTARVSSTITNSAKPA